MDEERKNPTDMSDDEFFEYLNDLAEQDESFSEGMDAEPEEDSTAPTPDAPEETTSAIPEEDGSASEGITHTGEPPDVEAVGGESSQSDIIARITDYAKQKYPDSENALESLLSEFDGEMASGRGITPEEYRARRSEEQEFEQWKKERDDRRRSEEGAQKVIAQWEADAQKLKAFVPEFDLRRALQNEGFKQSLLAGEDVFSAYKKANPLPQEKKSEPAISEVGRRAGISGRSAEEDVSALPRDEFMKRMRRIMEE